MQIRYAKNKVRDRRGVSYSPYFDIAVDCLHTCLAFKVASFNAESVVLKFPKIKTQADHYGKLRMDARKIMRNDRVKSPDNCQLSAVFLSKIAKCKKFYFNNTFPRLDY